MKVGRSEGYGSNAIMGHIRTLVGCRKVWFKKGFDKFLSTHHAMIRYGDRKAVFSVVKRFLNALSIGKYDVMTREYVLKLISQSTIDKMFQCCIQREKKEFLDPHFSKLKAQSVRSHLTHFNKLLLFLEYYNLMKTDERTRICRVLNNWRKHLLQYSDPAKLTALVDVNTLQLKELYANVLECLMERPQLIVDYKSAIKARDSTICKIARNFGKRPGELASISVYGIKYPTRQELTFCLEASPEYPSKVKLNISTTVI